MDMRNYLICCLFLLLFVSCVVAPQFPDIPEISFEGVNKTIVDQGRIKDDTLQIRIAFTDGDGDIGDPNNEANIFLIDDRDKNVLTYSMPVIPQKGSSNGVKGTITIFHTTLFNVCCYYANADPCTIPSVPTTNTVNYTIYIKDRSGNKSNELKLAPIIINCK
jgi:hypothetical protein